MKLKTCQSLTAVTFVNIYKEMQSKCPNKTKLIKSAVARIMDLIRDLLFAPLSTLLSTVSLCRHQT